MVCGFPCVLNGKESAYNAGDTGLISGLGRSTEEGNSNTLQYSWLENSGQTILVSYSLWGCKELDMTEWLHVHFLFSERSRGFPYFLQFKSEFGNKAIMIWATVSSQSCFCWLYRGSPSLAAKNIINLISVLTIWWCPCVESSLVLLEEGVWYDQCVLLAKLC